MADTSQALQNLQDSFDALDQIREILPVVKAGFRIKAGPVTATMSPEQVAEMRTRYAAAVSKLKSSADRFPGVFF